MEKNKFENKVKNVFNSYHPQLNEEEIWDNIEPHLKKKKKRKPIFLWWGLVGLVLFSTFTIYKLTLGVNHGNEKHKEVFSKPNSEERISIQNSKTIQPPPQNVPLNNVFNTHNQTQTKPENLSKIESRYNLINNITRKINNSADGSLVLSNDEKSSSQESLGVHLSLQEKIAFINQPAVTFLEMTSSKLTINSTTHFQLPQDIKSSAPEPLIKKKEKERQFFIQATMSGILPLKHLNVKQGTQYYDDYLKGRKDTETQLEAFGFGVSFQLKGKNGLLLTSGLEFQQFNERFHKKSTSTTEEIRTGIVTVTENALGEIINSTTGAKSMTITKIDETKIYNNYRFYNLFLGVGKKLNTPKHNISLFGGLYYNLNFVFSGTILNSSLDPFPLDKNDYSGYYSKFFKSKAGPGIWIASDYNHQINDRLSLIISPKFQIPFSSISAVDYKLSERFYVISLNVGLKHLVTSKNTNPIKSD